MQVVKGNIILLQDIVDRIILAGRNLQVHIRQERAESRNVDHRIAFQLPGEAFVYFRELIGHRLDIRIAGQDDSEVPGVEGNAGSVFIAVGA